MSRVAHCWWRLVPGHLDTVQEELPRHSSWKSVAIAERLLGRLPPGYSETRAWVRLPDHPVVETWDRRLCARLVRRWYERAALRFWRTQVQELAPRVLHAHFGFVGWHVMPLRQELGVPLVVTFYGTDVSWALYDPIWRERIRQLGEAADRLVVLCDEAKTRLQRLGCPEEKIVIWNYPIDMEALPYRERAPGPVVKLLCAARYAEMKGHQILLHALAEVAKRTRAIQLTLVGYGPLERQVMRLARELHIASMVRVMATPRGNGFFSLYRRLLEEHDLFILPSIQARDGEDEGGPALSMVMAQATGMPVISTAFPGHERSVLHGQTGLIVPPDPQALSQAIQDLLHAPACWPHLGQAGSRLVRQSFALKPQLTAMAQLYEEVCSASIPSHVEVR